MEYKQLIANQVDFFNTQETKDIQFRLKALKKLKIVLQKNEDFLYQEIYKDFKKSAFETYATELGVIYHEIDLAIAKMKKWTRKKRVSTGIANLPGKSYIVPEPLGVTLIIGAWNYPYQLSFAPAVAAIAAGCTVILKPSEIAPHTASAMAKLVNDNFVSKYFAVVEGGVSETTSLLENKFDKIFFTGSVQVGKIIYQAAAKHLTPVTLELGGKSPAIVTKGCNIDMTAKRLVWAKYLNTGQTCVAPDYIMVDKDIVAPFLDAIKKYIEKADYKIENQNYTQIINQKNYERLCSLIDSEKIFYGGKCDPEERTISPTVLENVTFSDPVMQDEIFGPILPVITYTSIEEAIGKIQSLSKPLTGYLFTKDRAIKNKVLKEISFGGGAINDAVMQFMEEKLPFGGVGNSGIGNYHGPAGFKTFSHYKSILQKPFWFEPNIKYSPYSTTKLKILKRLIK